MDKVLSAFDIYYLVKEFQLLIGSKFDKIYQNKETFFFQLHVPNKGKHILKVSLPNLTYFTQYKFVPEQPPGFCMFLRKYITNARIINITQVNAERIICIDIETKEEKFKLYIELFKPSNILLIQDGKIKGLYKTQNFKDRVLRGGIDYSLPDSGINLFTIGFDEFKQTIEKSDKDNIVKTLAIDFFIGGMWSEEICHHAKVSKNRKGITEDELKSLYQTLQEFKDKPLKPVVLTKDEKPFDILPFKFETKSSDFQTDYESYSQALDEVFSDKYIEQLNTESNSKKNQKLKKTKKIIDMQEKKLLEFEKQLADNQRIGEVLYEQYQPVSQILEQLKIARKTMSWKELKEKLKGHKIIKSINEQTGEITIELD